MWFVRSRRCLVWLVVMAGFFAAGYFLIETPMMANQFGYALPGEKGLPYRISHNNRDYHSAMTCAGASWCRTGQTAQEKAKGFCTPGDAIRKDLSRRNRQLTRTGEVYTLFGPAREIFAGSNSVLPLTLYVEAEQNDCYVEYGLMGGP
jgi:hypothetical protein